MKPWYISILVLSIFLVVACPEPPVADPSVLSLDIIQRYRINEEALKKIPVRLDKKLVIKKLDRETSFEIEREKVDLYDKSKSLYITFPARSKGWIVKAGWEGNFIDKLLEKEVYRIYVTFEDTTLKPPHTLVFRPNHSNGFELETYEKFRRRYTNYMNIPYECISGFEANALLVDLEKVKQVSEEYRTIISR